MHYLSPAFLFGKTFQLPFDARTLQRERKRLLAELELAGGESLELNGRSFTKNELIDYFEALQQEEIAAWHRTISEDSALLDFLQNASIDTGAHFKDADCYNDLDFIAWISPYFRSAFARLTTNCFELPNAAGMRTILDNKLIMTPGDTERSWLFISGILEKNIALFDNYRGRCQKNSPAMMPITQISAFIGHGYIEVIRQLPDSRFAREKNTYAFNMQHPAIAVFNRDTRNRSLSIIWLEEALTLAVSADIKNRIQTKLDELNRILKKQKKRYALHAVWIMLVLGRILATIAGNSDDSSIQGFPQGPSKLFLQPTPTLELPDSVVVRPQRKDSGSPHKPPRLSP